MPSLLLKMVNREGALAHGTDPGELDPEAVVRTMRRLDPLFGPRRYFRLDVRGLERVPPPPVMLVSNHSGGTTIPDVWGFVMAWYRHFGTSRPLHLMAHEIVFGTEATARFFGARGVLRASRETARTVLARFRRDLLVMPGGDLDTWRPHRRRFEVEFAGRTGYARIALELGTTIVPVANAGAQDTLWVLTDGRRIARALHIKRIARAEIWPIHLSLPWGLAIGPWPHLPLPVRLSYRVGEPLVPGHDETTAQLDARVRASVQSLLDELSRRS